MSAMKLDQIWECPLCGCQMAAGPPVTLHPPTCGLAHESVEMEQKTVEAWPLPKLVNVCPNCAGQGWEPDKPWKGEHRNWFVCSRCRNAADLPEPAHPPTDEDWARQGGT